MRAIPVATISVALAVLAAGCGGDNPAGPGDSSGGTMALQLETFQAADFVIGQPDMVSSLGNGGASVPGAATLSEPDGAGAGSFYVPDGGNNRVLGFDAVPSGDGAAATFVMGQPDFSGSASGTTDRTFNFPTDCFVADGRLFVADLSNNRVLIWNSLPTADVPADVVVGQPDFTSSAFAATRTGLRAPTRVAAAGGRLFVCDNGNHRVLVWNTIPATNGAAADVVIGQPDFTSSAQALSPSGLSSPTALWTDGARLAVGDFGNRRVLVWSGIPAGNGAPADLVLGAPDFVTVGPASASATSVGTPAGLASDGTSLFLVDSMFHRVLIFSPFPGTNGAAASGVLGQSDFTHSAHNDANQDGVSETQPTARTLSFPNDVKVIGNRLLVADEGNNRILVFSSRAG